MIVSGKKIVAKIIGIDHGSRLKAIFEGKKGREEREEKERVLRLALLSGSIRRIK